MKASNPTNTSSSENVWFVDSGASNHMMSHEDWFRDLRKPKQPDYCWPSPATKQTKGRSSGADRSRGQAKWERAEESVGPERITEGKEWSHREDVMQE